ncbi:hypothetical protein KBD81_00415 [Candidatus Woesebacteria bacterium]|nr:hypothetical protein [Candidatus Woesebacteria bacterium]
MGIKDSLPFTVAANPQAQAVENRFQNAGHIASPYREGVFPTEDARQDAIYETNAIEKALRESGRIQFIPFQFEAIGRALAEAASAVSQSSHPEKAEIVRKLDSFTGYSQFQGAFEDLGVMSLTTGSINERLKAQLDTMDVRQPTKRPRVHTAIKSHLDDTAIQDWQRTLWTTYHGDWWQELVLHGGSGGGDDRARYMNEDEMSRMRLFREDYLRLRILGGQALFTPYTRRQSNKLHQPLLFIPEWGHDPSISPEVWGIALSRTIASDEYIMHAGGDEDGHIDHVHAHDTAQMMANHGTWGYLQTTFPNSRPFEPHQKAVVQNKMWHGKQNSVPNDHTITHIGSNAYRLAQLGLTLQTTQNGAGYFEAAIARGLINYTLYGGDINDQKPDNPFMALAYPGLQNYAPRTFIAESSVSSAGPQTRTMTAEMDEYFGRRLEHYLGLLKNGSRVDVALKDEPEFPFEETT